MPYPWSRKFVVNKLIIIYLEANKDENSKWNTLDNNDNNRIYLFDDSGKELKTPGDMTKEGGSETKFFKIKIEKNVLSIIKDGKPVPFAVIDAAVMTLAKLISTLLGQEIEYKNNANDQGPYQPQLQKAKVSTVPAAQPFRSSSSSSSSNLPRPPIETSSSSGLPPRPPDDDNDEEREGFEGGKGKKSRKKQRNGVKKSRKQSKGGKKSRKQRKSLRKNKRSISKK